MALTEQSFIALSLSKKLWPSTYLLFFNLPAAANTSVDASGEPVFTSSAAHSSGFGGETSSWWTPRRANSNSGFNHRPIPLGRSSGTMKFNFSMQVKKLYYIGIYTLNLLCAKINVCTIDHVIISTCEYYIVHDTYNFDHLLDRTPILTNLCRITASGRLQNS